MAPAAPFGLGFQNSALPCLALLLLIAAGCSSDSRSLASGPDGLTGPNLEAAAALVGMDCVEGCQDPDPDPTAPGYFFPGTENQWSYCADGNEDFDNDGLDDGCEYLLAHAFRPELSFVYFDYLNRDPHWAAEWVGGDAGSMTVRIAYLMSYWLDIGDGGTSGTFCGLLPFGNPCTGHLGDSEWIRLDVTYDADSQHWFLSDAKYSAHTSHVEFNRVLTSGWLYVSPRSDGGGAQYPRNYMEYPDGKVGGYPRSYAADGKHANYPTEAYCDGPGGLGGADDCAHPRSLARFDVTVSNNLGSRSHRFVDCTPTADASHPDYSAGLQECYWSNTQRFRGWFIPDPAQGSAEPYGQVLNDHFGF